MAHYFTMENGIDLNNQECRERRSVVVLLRIVSKMYSQIVKNLDFLGSVIIIPYLEVL